MCCVSRVVSWCVLPWIYFAWRIVPPIACVVLCIVCGAPCIIRVEPRLVRGVSCLRGALYCVVLCSILFCVLLFCVSCCFVLFSMFVGVLRSLRRVCVEVGRGQVGQSFLHVTYTPRVFRHDVPACCLLSDGTPGIASGWLTPVFAT